MCASGHQEAAVVSSKRRKAQSQARGVNPGLYFSNTLHKTSGEAPNKPGAKKAQISTQKGRRQLIEVIEADPDSAL